ncbi:hypothetical protein TEA_001770 [Camellia sinensis var. sinensis]|uniref:Ubiquitin-like domain-containing protein n=1 Tax=Camellia sinensis var. sinensis TaxID=542762 RepID=A0A4S4D8P1_CAMSN|nr:hypothetical protein TEA_001770 [Camellia sinensis var. sinensis]
MEEEKGREPGHCCLRSSITIRALTIDHDRLRLGLRSSSSRASITVDLDLELDRLRLSSFLLLSLSSSRLCFSLSLRLSICSLFQKFSGLLKEMGSKGSDEVIISGSEEANCSEATVEIKIKTLDSQTYTLRVDKCVPVPALKEQIATVTGVLSEQQRLICRGKVLKDDQLLSAYLSLDIGAPLHKMIVDVEDGHTLHLVVRQPIPSLLESSFDPATDPASGTNRQGTQAGPSVVVGTFNISEQGDGVLPDFSRIVSAVLSSFGITNAGSGNEGADLREAAPERLLRTLGVSGLRNSSGQQTDQNASVGQSNPHNGGFQFSTSVPLEPLHPPVIPDSLTTLSQYLTRLRHEFIANVRDHSNTSQAASTHGSDRQQSDAAAHSAGGRAGLPTPASLAEVMLSTRQILTEQVADCLAQLARQLEDQATVNDPLTRMSIQSNTLRSAGLFRDLGALMLELGRTTMTLRMGQAPADAVVNAGPAVYISTSGPNPIMVQVLRPRPGYVKGLGMRPSSSVNTTVAPVENSDYVQRLELQIAQQNEQNLAPD